MALTDSFNAVYNKKEQAKIEKQKTKLYDEILEIQLIEDLQTLQLDYITKNNKNMLLLPKIKNKLINEVIQANNTKILKNSKYINVNYQKTYLLKKYDTITNKTLRLVKTFDKMQEEKETEEIQKQIEAEAIKRLNITQKPKNRINWGNIGTIIFYIILAPLALLWGILEGLAKGNKKRK